MAHYAFLDDDNKVTEVITGIDESQLIEGLSPENWYGNFRGKKCIRTSYNAKIRGKFAGIGDTYNEEEDIFIAPQPWPSWTRLGCGWIPPIPYPSDQKFYQWNEAQLRWDAI